MSSPYSFKESPWKYLMLFLSSLLLLGDYFSFDNPAPI